MNRVSHIPNGTCYNSSSTKNAEKCHIYLDLMRAIPCFAREIHDPHAMRKTLLRLNLLEVTSGQTLGVFRQNFMGRSGMVSHWGKKRIYIYICIWLRFPNSHVMGGPMIRPANNPFPTSFKQTCPTIAIKSPELKTFQVSVRWNLFKPQEAFLQALNQPTNKNILGHLTNQPQKKVMNFWGGELN